MLKNGDENISIFQEGGTDDAFQEQCFLWERRASELLTF